jgi:hypothetical protein
MEGGGRQDGACCLVSGSVVSIAILTEPGFARSSVHRTKAACSLVKAAAGNTTTSNPESLAGRGRLHGGEGSFASSLRYGHQVVVPSGL